MSHNDTKETLDGTGRVEVSIGSSQPALPVCVLPVTNHHGTSGISLVTHTGGGQREQGVWDRTSSSIGSRGHAAADLRVSTDSWLGAMDGNLLARKRKADGAAAGTRE
jgi:hypothetical protein